MSKGGVRRSKGGVKRGVKEEYRSILIRSSLTAGYSS